MRSPKLAALELRRFGRGKLPRLGLVALMLIPLLYGALYLFSFWDPYSRLDKIPVALVNDDRGATADGKKITAGSDLARNVKDSDTFDWQEVSSADAAKGLEEGTYYLSLTVPKNFSERIASSSGDSPQAGALRVRTNDANNYIVGSISKTVFSEIRAKTSAKSSRAFLDKIFVSFSDLHDETEKAADGARKIEKNLGKTRKGSGDLADGLGKLGKGAGDLRDGAGKAHQGAEDLKKGVGTAQSKIKQLSEGARQVADGTQKLANTANGLAGQARPVLQKYAKDLGEKARWVAGTSRALAADLRKLPQGTADAAADARQSADEIASLYNQRCGGTVTLDADCPALKKARDATAFAARTAEKVNSVVVAHSSEIDKLTGDLHTLDKVATEVADRAPTAERDLDAAVADINRLNGGAHRVSDGAGKIAAGTGQLADGAGQLADGTGKVADGAGQIHNKLGDAKEGADKLTGGLFKLKDGSNQLADGLHSGVAKIPDYNKKDRDARTEVMADPVELAAKSMHKAPNYGTGLAPYFIPLSLWVGAMVAFMLLQPLGKRALAAGAPGWRIALGSWLPAFAIGVVQVLALMAVLHWGLGLEMARSAGTVGFLLLATAAFTAIIQFFGARFGPAGRVLTLVVLMLQLTSAGGTYPVQTSPGFFAAIHPFLPMSYVVDGLRRLITGGDLAIVWQGSAVLVAFTLGALALTALTARGRQVVRMKDLHPELSL
ncbi:YhgE/Pip domain-containing protein [Streptomyces sp. NPDC048483]|uniref:YhgE/Pip domain-containing protein n=1 Tax=Streptomyces sp. NPDC048483 TaxID=3154927 RepID=UPI00344AFDE2